MYFQVLKKKKNHSTALQEVGNHFLFEARKHILPVLESPKPRHSDTYKVNLDKCLLYKGSGQQKKYMEEWDLV